MYIYMYGIWEILYIYGIYIHGIDMYIYIYIHKYHSGDMESPTGKYGYGKIRI